VEQRNNTLIIKILGVTMSLGIVGIIVLDVFRLDADPLQIIVSACVGALAAKLTDTSKASTDVVVHEDSDDLELLGRAVNKQLVAQFLREAATESDEAAH
jgi:1-deoxy-D-xylulose 5-phosphate reductoisomerase